MTAIRRRYFTLMELIVVMSIMFLTTSLAVAVFKEDTPAKKLADAALRWKEFCARVRFQSLESGEVREIVFDPEEKRFRMRIPKSTAEEEKIEEDSDLSAEKVPVIEWSLPEKFELSGDFPDPNEQPEEDGTYLMFRFFPDGSASGKRSLELHTGDLFKKFEISALTGRLIENNEEETK